MCPQQQIRISSSKELPVRRKLKYPQYEELLAHISSSGKRCHWSQVLSQSSWLGRILGQAPLMGRNTGTHWRDEHAQKGSSGWKCGHSCFPVLQHLTGPSLMDNISQTQSPAALSRINYLDSSEDNYKIPKSNSIFLEERFAMWRQTRTSKFISSRFSYCPPWMLECCYFSNCVVQHGIAAERALKSSSCHYKGVSMYNLHFIHSFLLLLK